MASIISEQIRQISLQIFTQQKADDMDGHVTYAEDRCVDVLPILFAKEDVSSSSAVTDLSIILL